MTQQPASKTRESEEPGGTVQASATALPTRLKPSYPTWPTSKRGPQTTPVPPGMRPMNAQRSEQMAEVGYNQITGEPSTQSPLLRSLPDENLTGPTSTDQPSAQEVMRKQK